LASGKSRIKIVPPFDEFLASLPAEINDLPVTFVGKVAEAAIKIFDLDAIAENLLDIAEETTERPGVLHSEDRSAAACGRPFAGTPDFWFQLPKSLARLVNLLKKPADLGQQSVRFFQGEYSHLNSIESTFLK
jgi:hypothetical protein